MRFALATTVLLLAAACGGAPGPGASSADPGPTSTPTVSAPATAAPDAVAWTVSDRSRATARVREQLAGVSLPNDAVMVVSGAAGSFTLNPDGTFTADSKISFDMNTIESDSRDRDNIVKSNTLEVRRFPRAELVPVSTSGLALPLASNGEFTFTLAGRMTIHGTTKDVTFDVTAKRAGGELTATATASPSWKFGDFGMEPPTSFRVLSVTDEIRLVVDLVATGAPS
jgi:polyisoprenoid-binding protein YceI